ncbi:uncharacterized protein LOC119688367 [Teleopsis dalmanni]|uniref:uncharacterized protein LOC119688367 n=1 Tax=Teleopsis dalmanni TaxID=139649 RepID=UPI0018CE5CCB|nr:uncharacterized protein LOC119688367 [Teleopsis dalmanni]
MQNKTMDIEKTPGSIFEEHQKTKYGTLNLGPEIKYYKRPKLYRTKTLMTAMVTIISLIMCCFFASVAYLSIGKKNKVVQFSALCAVPSYEEYNTTIPYLVITADNLNSEMRTVIAPQIFKDLVDNVPYGYFFRQQIDFSIMDGTRIHTVAINITDIMNNLVTQFIHNFKKNHTAIVDFKNKRCFIMKLNRNVTINAYKLFLSMQRMENIYPLPHGVQMVLPKRIVLPAVADLSFADKEMVKDCHDKYVYILTDYRPFDDFPVEVLITKYSRFYEFFGRGITEYSLVNLNEILLHEKQL